MSKQKLTFQEAIILLPPASGFDGFKIDYLYNTSIIEIINGIEKEFHIGERHLIIEISWDVLNEWWKFPRNYSPTSAVEREMIEKTAFNYVKETFFDKLKNNTDNEIKLEILMNSNPHLNKPDVDIIKHPRDESSIEIEI